MNTAELDRLFQQVPIKIVSAEITDGPGSLPNGVFEQAPRVIATLDDGSRVELFSFFAHERSFDPAEFVGLTVEEGRVSLAKSRARSLPYGIGIAPDPRASLARHSAARHNPTPSAGGLASRHVLSRDLCALAR